MKQFCYFLRFVNKQVTHLENMDTKYYNIS